MQRQPNCTDSNRTRTALGKLRATCFFTAGLGRREIRGAESPVMGRKSSEHRLPKGAPVTFGVEGFEGDMQGYA